MKKFNTTFLYLFFFSTVALAQLPVIRSTFTGPYTPINMPAATLSTASGDDDVQSAIPLGFTFNYLGINYTTSGSIFPNPAKNQFNVSFNNGWYNCSNECRRLSKWYVFAETYWRKRVCCF